MDTQNVSKVVYDNKVCADMYTAITLQVMWYRVCIILCYGPHSI